MRLILPEQISPHYFFTLPTPHQIPVANKKPQKQENKPEEAGTLNMKRPTHYLQQNKQQL